MDSTLNVESIRIGIILGYLKFIGNDYDGGRGLDLDIIDDPAPANDGAIGDKPKTDKNNIIRVKGV